MMCSNQYSFTLSSICTMNSSCSILKLYLRNSSIVFWNADRINNYIWVWTRSSTAVPHFPTLVDSLPFQNLLIHKVSLVTQRWSIDLRSSNSTWASLKTLRRLLCTVSIADGALSQIQTETLPKNDLTKQSSLIIKNSLWVVRTLGLMPK